MCQEPTIIPASALCAGRCEEGADRTVQRSICHGEDSEQLKARIKKLNSEAGQLKMDLHDLAEDLPNGWERIPEVAEKTYRKCAELIEARERLKAPSGSSPV